MPTASPAEEAASFIAIVAERERRQPAWPCAAALQHSFAKRKAAFQFWTHVCERHGLSEKLPERALNLYDMALTKLGPRNLGPEAGVAVRLTMLACLRLAWKAGDDQRHPTLMNWGFFAEKPVSRGANIQRILPSSVLWHADAV